MYDVHAHLVDGLFHTDLKEVLERAKSQGVKGVVAVSETLEEAEKVLELSHLYPGYVYPCAGMHPEKASLEHLPSMLNFIRNNKEQLCAVGEVGLDYTPYVLGSDPEGVKAVQEEVFIQQAKLAKELNLPLNVHSRGAGHYVISLLKELEITDVVLHAFDGKNSYIKEAIRYGYYFSIPPSISRSDFFKRRVECVPIEYLLLETDSPALGPEKEMRNEPGNINISCKEIAAIKGIPFEKVARITTENAQRLFKKII